MELVRRGLCASRDAARRLIADDRVTVNGAIAQKPSRQVLPADAVEMIGPPPAYVSRGAEKLAHALEAFAIEPAGWRCLDVGASTGGFTDVLLQRGASSVVALDVGHGQLHERIRSDGRVRCLERTNIRHVEPSDIGGPFQLVTVDVSFISLRTVMPALVAEVDDSGLLVVLVKPQFEAGRAEASKGQGVITSPVVWRRVLHEVIDSAGDHGLALVGLVDSPITGGDGNVEFVAVLGRGDGVDVDDAVHEVVARVADPGEL